MNRSNSSNSQLSLTPLGAGDLIDRSVRFYRKNFWTFILIASPPIVVGGIFLIGWMILARNIFAVNVANPIESTLYRIFIYLGSLVIWFIQLIAVFAVMGGASRNFVRHIIFGEAITFRETYKNVKSRIFGLIGVSTLLIFLLGIFGIIVFYFGLIVALFSIAFATWIFQFAEILVFLVSIALGSAIIFASLWLFFLVVSRFVYVPQVMLVEGQGAFSAIGRSSSLAGKNVKRVAALFIFTLVATYSALALFYMPLGWYAWFSGINLGDLITADTTPAWYEISTRVIMEISLILLTPVLMIGLCLLYVDERVHSEGYDVELMAANRLGDIPTVPQTYVNPLQPALSKQTSPQANQQYNQIPKQADLKAQKSSNSVLGLD
ncbi:MAG: hypothetical protein M3405_03270 [Acidobacteriota bacterium]|nr:hypothetical protein [Acidobacteriota bacterium]